MIMDRNDLDALIEKHRPRIELKIKSISDTSEPKIIDVIFCELLDKNLYVFFTKMMNLAEHNDSEYTIFYNHLKTHYAEYIEDINDIRYFDILLIFLNEMETRTSEEIIEYFNAVMVL